MLAGFSTIVAFSASGAGRPILAAHLDGCDARSFDGASAASLEATREGQARDFSWNRTTAPLPPG